MCWCATPRSPAPAYARSLSQKGRSLPDNCVPHARTPVADRPRRRPTDSSTCNGIYIGSTINAKRKCKIEIFKFYLKPPYISEQRKDDCVQCRTTFGRRTAHRTCAAAQATTDAAATTVLRGRRQMAGRGDVGNTAAVHHVAAVAAVDSAAVVARAAGQRRGRTFGGVAVETSRRRMMMVVRRGVPSIAVGSSQARPTIFDFVGGGWWGGGCGWDAVREMAAAIRMADTIAAAAAVAAVRSSVVQRTYLRTFD